MKTSTAMLRNLCLLLSLLLFSCAYGQRPLKHIGQLREADLIFHIAAQGNAITEVTASAEGYAIDHVAVFFRQDGKPMVVEADERGTVVSPLDSLLKNGESFVAGRVRGQLDKERSVANALQYLGRPYDYLYLADNEEIYCSELVQLSFVDKQGRPVFSMKPMNFRNADGQIPRHWTALYARHGMEVPQGELGTNPADMARHKRVRLKYIIATDK